LATSSRVSELFYMSYERSVLLTLVAGGSDPYLYFRMVRRHTESH
jgi:hypothetical protein